MADREMVESAAEDILRGADYTDVAFLVVGDPFGYAQALRCRTICFVGGILICVSCILPSHAICDRNGAVMSDSGHCGHCIPAQSRWNMRVMCRATTHTDLELRARRAGIAVRVIHNASIMNAVGVCGLQLYRFGEVSAAYAGAGPGMSADIGRG